MLAPGSTERPSLPTTGMRGGLGRTLLTAFLILAIVPLSTISWYATTRGRRDIQREVTAKLSSVTTMIEMQARQWARHHTADLAFLAALPDTAENVGILIDDPATGSGYSVGDITAARDALRLQLQTLLSQDPAFRLLAVLDSQGRVLVSTAPQIEEALVEEVPTLERGQDSTLQPATLDPTAGIGLIAVQCIASRQGDEPLGLLVGWLNLDHLVTELQAACKLGETGEIYLVDANGVALPQGKKVTSAGIEAALSGENIEGLQEENYRGVPVIGVYRWIPELELALVAEQAQEEAFATTDGVTAAVVGATLVVALVTAVIAAVVTRQMTRPIVQLTESALSIAEGDLEQRVPVTSRDEIGILAYVFNRMAAELKALYDDLEGKVVERTALLQRANYQIQRRAIQMQASLEVSQAVTSILDPDQLLKQVVQVVKSRFVYSYAAVYTTNDGGSHLLLRASAGEAEPFHGQLVPVDLPGSVGRAFREGTAVVENHPVSLIGPPSSYTRTEVALPLCLGDRALGVLDVQSTDEEDFDQDDVFVLQNVANQITTALENARAYAVEREAVKRLQELDRSKRQFLANMSHELRTPLTNIIGFSQLMLKGVNGSLTGSQKGDLQIIYQDSQHLLGLINDLLDISHIEAGLMELEFQEVDLVDLIHSVMATASALVRDKDVELHQEIAPDIPKVQVDTMRIRQVLLRLLANAAKFTEQGTITVQAQPIDGEIRVSVSDTGMGIPPEDQERIFQQFEQGSLEDGRRPSGAGLGLALSKEFVEMHGGRIWVESEVGKGATFTFSLPLSQE
jgi:signal transduction histidine kinase/HAMP domain-containing protein